MIRWSALLSMALLMLPVSGCNKGRGGEDNPDQPDQPEQLFTAMSEVGLVSSADINPNSTRAEFIGEVGHKTHMPNLIKWGETGGIQRNADGSYTIIDEKKALPVWVLPKRYGVKIADDGKLFLTDDYNGVLIFDYWNTFVNPEDNNKFKYFAVVNRGKDTWMNGGAKDQEAGAWVNALDHSINTDWFILHTDAVPEIPAGLKTRRPYIKAGRWDDKCGWRPIDISNRSVAWPLISHPADENYKPDPSKFWCELEHSPKSGTTSKGQVYFKLFGNMVNIRIANNSGKEAYDVSYPNNTKAEEMFKRPHLIIESNCMLFAPAKFRFDPGQNGGYDITINSKVNKIAFRVDNLKFTKRGEEQNFPIWFRPVPPPAGEDCKIKITWKIYSVADRKWYTETRNLNPDFAKNNIYPATGTVFDAFDGHYYTFDLAFNASYGLEFGTEKFVEIVNDVPAFD